MSLAFNAVSDIRILVTIISRYEANFAKKHVCDTSLETSELCRLFSCSTFLFRQDIILSDKLITEN